MEPTGKQYEITMQLAAACKYEIVPSMYNMVLGTSYENCEIMIENISCSFMRPSFEHILHVHVNVILSVTSDHILR